MLIKYRKLGILFISLMILLASAACGLAADPEGSDDTGSLPELPLILKGDLDVNGEPVAAGSEIEAYYEGKLIAKSTVENEGEYVLNLNLATDDYDNLGEVEFYIDGNEADLEIPESQAAAIANEDAPGSIVEVDVQSSVSQSSEPSGDSGNSDGSSDGDNVGDAVIVNDEDVSESSVEEPEEMPESEENIESGTVAEAEGKTSSESPEAETTPIWGALAIVSLLSAVLLVRKMMQK